MLEGRKNGTQRGWAEGGGGGWLCIVVETGWCIKRREGPGVDERVRVRPSVCVCLIMRRSGSR